jgi:hypothetical protein
MLRTWKFLAVAFVCLTLLNFAGCMPGANQPPAGDPQPTSTDEHAHKPGQHGGTVVEIGKDNHHAEARPKATASAKAKQLYLTPGGKYTAADIKANGSMTARQKYGDEMSKHDAHPKPGEKICPISQTKANPKFTWVVDGKTYEFCCTACIDEFVRTAKEKPDRIKEPGDYVQK